MKKETRTVVYDDELRLEAYRFEGTQQPFPNHFHEYFVIGFVEDGERCLFCRNQEYVIKKGNIVLFNPGDNHGCVQNDGGAFDYRGLDISRTVMSDFAEEVTGKRTIPGFSKNVIFDEEVKGYLRPLHEMIMTGSGEFGKKKVCFSYWLCCFRDMDNPLNDVFRSVGKRLRKPVFLWNSTMPNIFI